MGEIRELLQDTTVLRKSDRTSAINEVVERTGVPLDQAIQAIRADLPEISRLAFPRWREKDTVGLNLEGPAIQEGRFETLYAGLYDPARIRHCTYTEGRGDFMRVTTKDKKGVADLDRMLLLAHNLFTAYPTELTEVGLHINDFAGHFCPGGAIPAGGPGLAMLFRADSVKLDHKYWRTQKYSELLLLE